MDNPSEHRNKHSEEEPRSQSKWPLIISAIIIAGAVSAYFLFPGVNQFLREAFHTLTSENEARISDWVDNLGIWGPLFIVLAMSLQMFLLVIPSPLLIVISVLAYGPFWGSLISIVAVALASTLGFVIGKYLGEVFISKIIGTSKQKKLSFYVNRYGVWAVFITRITPILSNDAISFVSGILRMNYWKFIAATLGGITPLVILIAYFGENNERLKSGLIWISAVSLVILIVYVIIDRNVIAGKQEKENKENLKKRKS
ncbi:MAG: TVP38/TMEM64 family protein [Bacteroidales bacterium]